MERKDQSRKEIEHRSLSSFSAESSNNYSSEEVDYGSTVNESSISLVSNKKNPEVVNPEVTDTTSEGLESKADHVNKELQEKINILKIEAEYLCVMSNGLEVQVKDKKVQDEQLRQNNEQLQGRVLELEHMCQTRREEASLATPDLNELKGQLSNLQTEAESIEVKGLKSRINTMQQELNSLHSHKFELKLPGLVESPRLNNQGLERKIEELADKFQMKMENQIRILSQRIHMAEQIHTETKDGYKKVKEQLESTDKKAVYGSELVKLRDIMLEPGNSVLTKLDLLVKKLDEDNGNFQDLN